MSRFAVRYPGRRGRLAAVLIAAITVVSGCAAIPVSGPIETGDPVLSDPADPIPLADDPPQDASAEAIVQGFLVASAVGLADRFVVARKYLTTAASASWVPTAKVLIYPANSQPEVEVRDDDTAVVSIDIQGSLDESGVYTEAAEGAGEVLGMELRLGEDGQWRISTLEDVVMMSSTDFDAYYREAPVYFVSSDGAYLVPDLRWFPFNTPLSSAARAVLGGPSPWLRDAVRTGAPDGTRLGASGVTLEDETATVDLTSTAASADPDQRNLLIAQLSATLKEVPGVFVSEVVVTAAGGQPWGSTASTEPVRDPQPGSGPFVLAGNHLQVLNDGEVVPVAGVADLPADARSPAVSIDGQVHVVLRGTTNLLRLPADGSAPTAMLSGTGLLAPTIDRFNWTWTGEQLAGVGLVAVSPDGALVSVHADWLSVATVRSIAVSRDGSRIAVVSRTALDRHPVVQVAAVLRDEDGRPQGLGAAVQVGSSMTDATQVEWANETTLAVLGLSGSLVVPSAHLVPVGGQSSSLPPVDGAVTVAAGLGVRAIYLADDDGTLFMRQGSSWTAVASGVRDPVFPG